MAVIGLRDVHARIVPRNDGEEIAYKVNNKWQHGGITVFVVFADYVNTVVKLGRHFTGSRGSKTENIKSYKMYAPPAYIRMSGAKKNNRRFLYYRC